MANILIAGGAGFIGSHTLLALSQSDHKLIILDNLSNGRQDQVLVGELVEGELSDGEKLDHLMNKYEIEAVIHFAASIEAGESMTEPLSFYRNNVAGTLALLQSMARNDVRKLVFSSTAAVYGQIPGNEKLTETLPKLPINPYGHSKWMVECMLRDLAAAGQLEAIALRYFNAAGSDPEARIGERHEPETHLIPLVLDAARGARSDIKIFGTDYETPDGTCIRDYIHVSDLARAHVCALDKLLDLAVNEQGKTGYYDAFNLGTGAGYSVREVIETAKKVTGIDFTVIEEARREGDPATLVADASRALDELGWEPIRSDLETLIGDAWRYRKALDA